MKELGNRGQFVVRTIIELKKGGKCIHCEKPQLKKRSRRRLMKGEGSKRNGLHLFVLQEGVSCVLSTNL